MTHKAHSLDVLSVVNPHTWDSATTQAAKESTGQDSLLGKLTVSVPLWFYFSFSACCPFYSRLPQHCMGGSEEGKSPQPYNYTPSTNVCTMSPLKPGFQPRLQEMESSFFLGGLRSTEGSWVQRSSAWAGWAGARQGTALTSCLIPSISPFPLPFPLPSIFPLPSTLYPSLFPSLPFFSPFSSLSPSLSLPFPTPRSEVSLAAIYP